MTEHLFSQEKTSSVHAKKRFGQHFLRDTSVLESIVLAIHPQPCDHFVEIGPGHGELTEYLIPMAKQMDLIEIDRDLVTYLKHKFSHYSHVRIWQADALNFPLENLLDMKPQLKSLRIIGNLPYNISTPLLFKLFEQASYIIDMLFMLQKEVVDRLTAKLNTSNYGRLSVMSQYFCHNSELFSVPNTAFNPPPKVESAVILMQPKTRDELQVNSMVTLENIVREAFNHRRKTLSNALRHLISVEDMEKLHINSKKRPQEISLNEFIKIANFISTIEKRGNPS